jgi:predicted neuraminidase
VTQRPIFEGWRDFRLACAAQIFEAPNGNLLCWWLSGSDKEPASDNCILLVRSLAGQASDRGKTWSEPMVWIPAGEEAGAVGSVHVTPDRRMIAFGANWPPDKLYTVWHFFRMESADSGRTWTRKGEVTLREENNVNVGSPIRLRSGELLMGASFFEKRARPLTASVAQLCEAKSEAEALALPPQEEGIRPGKYGTHLHGCSVFITADEDLRNLKEYGHIANRPLGLLEPACVQLADGRIVMLMRAEWSGFLWRAESADNGRTWSQAWETDIPNPSSAISLVRLPDGRIALVHNAVGTRCLGGIRNPLSIWISDDELASWRIKKDVIATSNNPRPSGWNSGLDHLAYPSAIVLDGKLVFVYDRNRRQVMFVEVEIPPR